MSNTRMRSGKFWPHEGHAAWVVFKTGEVTPEPFCLIGYKGSQISTNLETGEQTTALSSRVDTGLVFIHDGSGNGKLLPHQTDV